jgi:ribonuclease HI
VSLTTDSEYLRNAFTQKWLDKWQKNGWRTAAKKPVLNADLWRGLLEQAAIHNIEWHWVRGHNEDEYNERCDQLAVEARLALAEKM